jgi:carbon-monoxide dehydrogenase medium subunit
MYSAHPAPFEYHRPESLDEAVALLAGNSEARPLAGGHSLLPLMKMRLAPPSTIVDLGRLRGLDGIRVDDGTVTIGAMATHGAIAASDAVRASCAVLAEAASEVGDRQVRNRGTIGGSLAHADPGADYPTVVKAVGATLVVRGPGGEREIGADDFFTGLFATALTPGELLIAVKVPATGASTGAVYVKHRHPASGFAVVGVAAVLTVEGGTCTRARVTIGGVGDVPVHADEAVQELEGRALSVDVISAAAQRVPAGLPQSWGDVYASAEYRTHLAGVLARRALSAAAERAGGAGSS